MDKLNTRDNASASMTSNLELATRLMFKNPVKIECFDKDGNLKWEEENYNLMTDEGLEDILDVYFSDGSQDSTHYVGLKGTGDPAAGDTLASHSNWTEFTDYSGDRKAWTEGGVSSKSITNSGSAASFSISGSGTVAGAFLTNAETGTSGVLVAAVNFTSARTVANGDTLNVTYTISIADA